ncbi:MAG: hypothetical protein ACFFDJ_08420 [Candidatus Odinarchaeota archaeon]
MRKGILILGLILLIVGFLPIILQLIGFGMYAVYFYLGFYTLWVAGFGFSELMLILIVLGVILIIVGAVA